MIEPRTKGGRLGPLLLAAFVVAALVIAVALVLEDADRPGRPTSTAEHDARNEGDGPALRSPYVPIEETLEIEGRDAARAATTPAETPPSPAGAAVTGRVLGESAQPAAGAAVVLAGYAGFVPVIPGPGHHVRLDGAFEPRVVFTDDDGRFRFEGVSAHAGYWITATAPPWFRAGRAPIEVGDRDVDVGPLLLEAGARIRGVVLDPAGGPLGEARIDLDVVVADTISDANGGFEMTVPAGNHALRVRLDGWVDRRPAERTFPTAAELDLVITLEPAARIHGRVLTPDGRPIAGAELRVDAEVTTSGTGGAFTIGGGRTGSSVVLLARRDGYCDVRRSDVVAGATAVTVTMTEADRIDVTCVDDEGAAVAPDTLWWGAVDREQRLDDETTIVWNPVQELAQTEDGAWRVHTQRTTHAAIRGRSLAGTLAAVGPLSIDGAPGAATLVFRRAAGTPVLVVDAEDGAPIAEAQVRARASSEPWVELESTTVVTGTDGCAIVDGLAPGRWMLHAEAPGYSGHERRDFTVVADAPTDRQRVRLLRTATLGGTLFGPDGRPAIGRPIRLAADPGSAPPLSVTDEEGRFRFDDVAAGHASLHSPGAAGHRLKIDGAGDDPMIEIPAGGTLDIVARIERIPNGTVIVLVTFGGVPRADVPVVLGPRPARLFTRSLARRTTDGSGRAVFEHCFASVWQARIEGIVGASWTAEPIEVPDGGTVEVTLEANVGRLDLSFVDARTRRPLSEAGEVWLAADEGEEDTRTWPYRHEPGYRIDALGRLVLDDVRAGTVRLIVRADGYQDPRPELVQVRAGDIDRVTTVALTAGGWLRISLVGGPSHLDDLRWDVVDESGARLAGGFDFTPGVGTSHAYALDPAILEGTVRVAVESIDERHRLEGAAPLQVHADGWRAATITLIEVER